MTIRLPDGFNDLNFIVGSDFPEADEDALWRCGRAWSDAAASLRALGPDAALAGARVLTAMAGESGSAFARLWATFTADRDGFIELMAEACEQLAAACDNAATEVEYAKIQYIAALVVLAATIAALAATIWAGGISAAGIPVAVAAAQVTIRLILVRLLTAMVLGAGVNVAIDLVAQAVQLSKDHRDGWDIGRTVRAAEDGAIYGAVGGGVFLAGGRLAPGLMSTPAGLAAGAGITGGVGGFAAPLAHGEVPTGRDVLLSLTSGIAGGLGPDIVRGRSGAPDLSGLAALDPGTLDPGSLDPGSLGLDAAGIRAEAWRSQTDAGADGTLAGDVRLGDSKSGDVNSGDGRTGDAAASGTWGEGGRGRESTGSPRPHAGPEPVIRADVARDLPGGAEPARRDSGEGRVQWSRPDAPELAGVSSLGPPAEPPLGAMVPPGTGSAGTGSAGTGSAGTGSAGAAPHGLAPAVPGSTGVGPAGVGPAGVGPAGGGPSGLAAPGAGPVGATTGVATAAAAAVIATPGTPTGLMASGAAAAGAAVTPTVTPAPSAAPGVATAGYGGAVSGSGQSGTQTASSAGLGDHGPADGRPRDPDASAPHWELTDAQAVELVRAHAFTTDAGLAFYAADDEVRDFARAIHPQEGFVTLDLHGSPKGFQVDDYLISPEQFAGALRALQADGILVVPEGHGIKLLSCDTAAGGDGSPAARLARGLGVEVIAPDRPVWTTLDGEEVVATPVLVDGDFLPTDPPDGGWHRFAPDGSDVEYTPSEPITAEPHNGDEASHDHAPRGPDPTAREPFGSAGEFIVGEGAGARLLGAERAVVDDRKLTAYALDPHHPVGRDKARVFLSVLGYHSENAGDLLAQIRSGVASHTPSPAVVDRFGHRFTVDISVTGPRGTAIVRTGWIYDPDATTPRLTTLYVRPTDVRPA